MRKDVKKQSLFKEKEYFGVEECLTINDEHSSFQKNKQCYKKVPIKSWNSYGVSKTHETTVEARYRAISAPIQPMSLSGKAMHLSEGLCCSTYCTAQLRNGRVRGMNCAACSTDLLPIQKKKKNTHLVHYEVENPATKGPGVLNKYNPAVDTTGKAGNLMFIFNHTLLP